MGSLNCTETERTGCYSYGRQRWSGVRHRCYRLLRRCRYRSFIEQQKRQGTGGQQKQEKRGRQQNRHNTALLLLFTWQRQHSRHRLGKPLIRRWGGRDRRREKTAGGGPRGWAQTRKQTQVW